MISIVAQEPVDSGEEVEAPVTVHWPQGHGVDGILLTVQMEDPSALVKFFR